MKVKFVFMIGALVLGALVLVFTLTKVVGGVDKGLAENLPSDQESFQLVSGGPGMSAKMSDKKDYTAEEFLQLKGSGREFFVVDVRELDEFADGRIPGAKNIPLGSLANRLAEIPKDKDVVLVCRSGRRSSMALETLRSNGFDRSHNLLGGMVAWKGEVER